MLKTFVVNCGSSSIKFQLIDVESANVLAKGSIERIGDTGTAIKFTGKNDKGIKKECSIKNHLEGIKYILDLLTDPEIGAIESLQEINAIGHRVVHGGEKFNQATLISEETINGIKECIPMAPLHNPANLDGILACKKVLPTVPQVAVFDTAFHQTIPSEAYLYAIPYSLYEKYGLRKYGFHGISHYYVSQVATDLLKKDIKELRLISCHLGNGASVTAVKGGKSIDTSMGFTPLDGLVMGTRCGEIDPAIIPFLMQNEDMTAKQVSNYLNKDSGLLGLSGISGDFRDIEEAAISGDKRALRAIDIVVYRVKKYIGSYFAAMGGVDAIVFTAGIGENSPYIRSKICDGLEPYGAFLDKVRNDKNQGDSEISTQDSQVKIFVISTNEELVIARETSRLCNQNNDLI